MDPEWLDTHMQFGAKAAAMLKASPTASQSELWLGETGYFFLEKK
jgi:hypothetical protein